jgi:hypothetical protein
MSQLIAKFWEWIVAGLIGALITIPLTLLLNDFFLDMFERLSSTRYKQIRQFNGHWRANYNRLDDRSSKEDVDPPEEQIHLRQRGDRVVGIDLLHRKVRLKGRIQERYWTGTWHDIGERAIYHGAFQLFMDGSGDKMTGRWIGFSSRDASFIKYGDWCFHRVR